MLLELSLEYRMPPALLAELLSENDLLDIMILARERGLPGRRQELYLAQIAQCVVNTQTDANASLADFLFEPPADEEGEPMSVDEMHAAFGFAPMNVEGDA